MTKEEKEKKAAEQKGKEKRKGIKETNISKYTSEQLVEMFNNSSGQDLKEKYPEVDFTRDQIRNYLEHEYHMCFLSTMIIPDYMSRMEVYRIIKEAIEGSKKGAKKGSVKDTAIRPVTYKLSQETTKQSCTMAVSTKERWDAFIKKQGIKKPVVLAYHSMALELLMDMVESGEVDISLK